MWPELPAPGGGIGEQKQRTVAGWNETMGSLNMPATPTMKRIDNVIFVITHDIGTELGCYGKPIQSLYLDRFAASGVRFEHAFTNSPCCSPSRCCLMTGKYAHTSGGIGLTHRGWPLPSGQRTVVDVFNDAGIETAHFGSSHERHPGENRRRTMRRIATYSTPPEPSVPGGSTISSA